MSDPIAYGFDVGRAWCVNLLQMMARADYELARTQLATLHERIAEYATDGVQYPELLRDLALRHILRLQQNAAALSFSARALMDVHDDHRYG